MSISSLRFPIIIRMAATWAIVVGVWVIIGWILGQEAMKTSLKDGSTMKFNTAICSILCGLTIWMQTFENPKIRRIGKVFPIIFVCLSFLSLFQTYFNVNLGIDELVFTDYVSRAKGLPHPGRTSTALSITFLFLGLGLIKYDSSNLWERKVSQWAFHAVSVFTFIFILSYLYEVPYLSKILIIGTMTLHSAVLTFSLSIICSLFNDDLAFTGLFLENTSRSRMARRIFPGVMVTIILLGLFRASTISKESLIGVEFGIALFSIGFMVIGLLILSISSYYLNQMEERKNDAEESLRQLNKDLELTIRKRTLELNQLNERFNLATSGAKVGVWDISIKDRRVVGNQVFYEIWGFPPDTKSILLDDLSARIHPEDREKTLSKFWEVATQKSRIDFEHRILVDGHEKYIKVSGAMEYDENGVAFRGVGIHTDITAQKLLEHDLKVSYEQIKTFIEEAPTALAMFDKEIRYLSVSKRWLQDYGLVGTNVIGRSHYEVFPEIGEDWKRIHQNCLNGERDVNTGSPFYRADGSVQWLSWVVCPWYVSEGEVGGILMHTVDITAERVHMEKLRQSEEKYHKMVEEVEDYAILLLDNEGKITNWNKGAELIKGYQADEILGKSHKQFYTEEDILQGLPEHLLKKARIEGKVQDEGWRVKKDGTKFWASISITALSDRNGNTIGFSKLTKDITHKKLAEDKLKKAKEDAELLAKAKSDFLSVMSHEIRTPMNAVIGFTDLLASENPRDDQKEYLQILQYSTNHLLGLVNDVLDYSKIEAGKLSFENRPFDLKVVMNNLFHMFNSKAIEKGLKFHLVPYEKNNLFVLGDELRLNQILNNLVGNAIKFTNFGEVSIGFLIDKESETSYEIRFQIKDSGIGIPNEKIGTIFDSFSQAEIGTSRKYGGTGLGLSISKSLVELQGGRIWVESQPGSGSNFEFTIHFGKVASAEKEIMENVGLNSLEGMRILLAEDNIVNVLLAKRLLEKWGCVIDVAANGAIAIEKFKETSYDLVLMDIQMPEMDGIQATSAIRRMETGGRIPIIALSANVETELEDKISKDFDEYISKPFDSKKLHGTLEFYSKIRKRILSDTM